jgi:UDP-N-acetylglucosamine--N-acetylmuramyl-(pentapeptide) pyrophosphoryl-undecaprenol N-acetylglucosamine transferase
MGYHRDALMLRVALAAGGTAGHVYPAVALADALAETGAPIRTFFLGSTCGRETELLPRLGRELHILPGRPFQLRSAAGKLAALAAVVPALIASRRILRELDIDVVVGFGGYASVGPILAARSLGIPTAIVDGNARLGLANRWLSPLVTQRFAGMIPVRGEIVRAATDRVSRDRRNVLVFGDRFLDAHVPSLLRELADDGVPLQVLHRSDLDEGELQQRYGERIPVTTQTHIDDVASAYGASDFVIARAGASTLAEISIHGRPALIVPLHGASENHQLENAIPHHEAGAAMVIQEHCWDPTIARPLLRRVLSDDGVWTRMAVAARSLAQPLAAQRVAHLLLAAQPGAVAVMDPQPTTLAAPTRLEGARG